MRRRLPPLRGLGAGVLWLTPLRLRRLRRPAETRALRHPPPSLPWFARRWQSDFVVDGLFLLHSSCLLWVGMDIRRNQGTDPAGDEISWASKRGAEVTCLWIHACGVGEEAKQKPASESNRVELGRKRSEPFVVEQGCGWMDDGPLDICRGKMWSRRCHVRILS